MLRSALVAVLFSAISFGYVHAAAPGSPAAELVGKYEGKIIGVSGSMYNFSWSVLIEEVTPDGTMRGRVTYPGMFCGAKDEPFTGRVENGSLVIPLPLGKSVRCQGFVYVLAPKGNGEFEGEYAGNSPSNRPYVLRLTLSKVN